MSEHTVSGSGFNQRALVSRMDVINNWFRCFYMTNLSQQKNILISHV